MPTGRSELHQRLVEKAEREAREIGITADELDRMAERLPRRQSHEAAHLRKLAERLRANARVLFLEAEAGETVNVRDTNRIVRRSARAILRSPLVLGLISGAGVAGVEYSVPFLYEQLAHVVALSGEVDQLAGALDAGDSVIDELAQKLASMFRRDMLGEPFGEGLQITTEEDDPLRSTAMDALDALVQKHSRELTADEIALVQSGTGQLHGQFTRAILEPW